MPFDPRTQEEIYTSIKNRLTGKIADLTNFVQTSFNYTWTHDAFAAHFEEFEAALVAVQLSGWPDYAGGPITDKDLESLGITGVDAETVNSYMDDQDLDELGKINGIIRDPGKKATGTVTFTVVDDTVEVPEGTIVATQPDSNGNYYSFTTDARAVPSTGQTSVSVNITASAVGADYNVGSGQITYMPSPPTGVQSVTNSAGTSGGEDEETNDDLRVRVKNAITDTSGGGTAAGIEGYIESNVTGVGSVTVIEYPDATPPYGDVVVDGGTDADVNDAIKKARPSSVRHNLVRPTNYKIGVSATITGNNVDATDVKTDVEAYLGDRSLDDDIYRDKVIQTIMNADENVDNIQSLDIAVEGETHTYATGTSIYALDKAPLEADGIYEVTDASGTTYTEGTDYDELDSDADGKIDSIEWLAGATPADTEEFYVSYYVENDVAIAATERAISGTVTITTA